LNVYPNDLDCYPMIQMNFMMKFFFSTSNLFNYLHEHVVPCELLNAFG